MMRIFQTLCLLGLLVCSGGYVFSQDMDGMIKEADRLEAIPNEKAALHQFKEVLKAQPVNLYVLCKCSELCSRIAGREPTTQSKDSYNQAAIIYGKTALRLYPNSDEANVAVAIAVGRTLLKKSGKEKVAIVKDIKQYVDMALKINPNNFKAWHVLGKWNYEIYNLSMLERALVKVFYGGLPEASLNNSIAAYEKARALNPQFALNYLELARTYHKKGDNKKAVSLLKFMLQLPIQTEDDPRIKKEATGLIKNWE